MNDDEKPATWAEFVEEISDPMTQEAVAFASIGCIAIVGFFVVLALLAIKVAP
jgi:hypothetical protein